MSSRLRGRSLLVAAFLVAACAGPLPTIRTLEPPLDPSSQPSAPSPTPTAEPTPAVPTVGPLQETPRPSGAPGDNTLPARAFAERDGIRLTIEVPFNPLWAPQGAEAVVTIENRSDRTLRWSTDGCSTNAWISATTTATWRDSHVWSGRISRHIATGCGNGSGSKSRSSSRSTVAHDSCTAASGAPISVSLISWSPEEASARRSSGTVARLIALALRRMAQ